MTQISDLLIKLAADYAIFPIVIIGALAMFRIPRRSMYPKFAWGLVAGLTALLLAKVASLLYQGQRPFVEMGIEPKAAYLNNPGFPSDHALLVFTITFVVWASTKNIPLSLMLLALSIAVSVGRVLALVHTPLDVLGGLACAALAAIIIYRRSLLSRNLPSS